MAESLALVSPKAVFALDESVRGETTRAAGLDIRASVPVVIADEHGADERWIENERETRSDNEPSVDERVGCSSEIIEEPKRIAPEADGSSCGRRSGRRCASHVRVRFAWWLRLSDSSPAPKQLSRSPEFHCWLSG